MSQSGQYHKGKYKENPVCRVFQDYIEQKRGCMTYLKARSNPQAPVDFLGRFYDKETNETFTKVAVEVRTLEYSKQEIEQGFGYIAFPISKLNELMMFWRLEKEVYIVYLLKDKVYFLNWDYYITHNFEVTMTKKGSYIVKLPIINFKYCGDFKS